VTLIFLKTGLILGALVLNMSWFLMIAKVRRREPAALRWSEHSMLKVCRLYREHYPGGKLVVLHWIALPWAVGFFLMVSYLQLFQRR